MNENDTYWTNAGHYTVIATIGPQDMTDDCHNLAVARHDDGHCDILVQDNATVWVLGDENDADRNAGQFATIAGSRDTDMDGPNLRAEIAEGVEIVRGYIDDIRAVDADIADWIEDRADDAANW